MNETKLTPEAQQMIGLWSVSTEVELLYYLVHSMFLEQNPDWEEEYSGTSDQANA